VLIMRAFVRLRQMLARLLHCSLFTAHCPLLPRHPPAIPLIHGCSNHPTRMRSPATSRPNLRSARIVDGRSWIVDARGGAPSPRANVDGTRTNRPT
jgi:hypothetical protein